VLSSFASKVCQNGQDKFASLFSLFVSERAKSIQEYPSGPFVGLGGFGERALKFGLGHLYPGLCQKIGDPRHPSSLKPRKIRLAIPHSSLPTLPRVYALQSKATPHLLRRKAGFTEKQRLSRVWATFCCPKWLRNPSCTGGLLEMDLGSLP
jgi:hypothetical protein